MHNWFVYRKFDDASKAAADSIAEKITDSIREHNICNVALPGGNSPARCLEYLAGKSLDWDKIHWYLGDERCVPVGHNDRNDLMLEKHLWSKLVKSHTHTIPAELGAEAAAESYANDISSIECFDIVFLGMGEDGHTASLFPENEALEDSRTVVPVFHSPKPPSDRVSLSLSTIRNARCRIVLTGGTAKSDVIKRIKNNEEFPINRIGDIVWYIDEAAVSEV